MNQRTALVVAVLFIFGGAMVAEFTGLTDRGVEAGSLAESAEEMDEAGGAITTVDEAKLRMLIIGGFVVACIFILMRATGEYF